MRSAPHHQSSVYFRHAVLVEEYGYDREDLHCEFPIKDGGGKRKRIDIAIFHPGTEHKAENIFIILEEGDLLITTDGTVGRVHLVTEAMTGWLGSNNMVRLWDNNTDMGFFYAYLATPYGLHQLRKDIYGGVVDHINESHIAQVLCPDVPIDEQHKIGNVVRAAFQKKDKANEFENEAIAELEAIISG